MKKIEAIVRSEKVGEVRQALEKIHYKGLTLTQVDGHGNQRGTTQKWKDKEYKIGIIPKTKIEIITEDKDVEKILDVIVLSARTGEIGDGKIFVYTVDMALRIRTGEAGVNAL
ncbi:MAG: P-II family nitrogen regulator [Candidatus Omnitrophica bacterium]|jgi:nitrogen regulatory protein P-II 1|nr:P-II family nitrogen regulator [Candidatus Omnitrophota bacterium]